MKVDKKSVKVKGYRQKKHTFTVETTLMSGYTFITVLKNDNPILKCTPLEYVKFKKLFS
tara:strand:- start:184 stop:360 length:177 start_codon:yes stop_codon:yes gene_type:complete